MYNKSNFYKAMKVSSFLLSVCIFSSFAAAANSQNAKVNIDGNNLTIGRFIDQVEQQTDYLFVYSKNEVDTESRLSVKPGWKTVAQCLAEAFKGTGVNYAFENDYVILTKNAPLSMSIAQQAKTVSGTVVDATGEPVAGANVVEKGAPTNGTITDIDGKFTLKVQGDAVLAVSYIGYVTQEITVGGDAEINVVLEENTQALDEVVVVGYGTVKKVNLSGAVDYISSDDIGAMKVSTMGEALMGQIANLNISIADGKPGRDADFNIRGTTSLNGGSPLIVIDGVPSTSSVLNNISPQDIETISVLKDAASAAIYGARAAYGVILIQTKQAKPGQISVSYENKFGWSTPTIIPDVYDDPSDYLDILQNEFCGNIGQPYFTQEQIDYAHEVAKDPSLPHAILTTIGGRNNLLLGGEVHNYYKEWFRKYSPKQNHHISITGGDEKIKYFLSGDYNKEEGSLVFKPEDIQRFSLRSNLTYNINNHVRLFNNTYITSREDDLPNQYLYNFCSNVYRFIENSNPMMPEEVEVDGEMIKTDLGFYRDFITNQSELTEKNKNTSTTLGTEISLFEKRLIIHGDYTYKYSSFNQFRWWDNKGPYISNNFNNRNAILDYYSDASPTKVTRTNSNTKEWGVNAYATYEHGINDHNFTIMAGLSRESYDYLETYSEHREPFSDITQHSLNLASGGYNNSDTDSKYLTQSLFFRLNYNWNSRYLIEVNGCYNSSSKFAKGNRSGFFPSVSAAWRISEEGFFESLRHVFSSLKLRGSYGSLGNQNIGAYDYLPIISIKQSSYTLEGSQVSYSSNPSPKSANFTWEKATTVDVGIDISAINNRLNATFDAYIRDTKNMLAIFRSLPSVYGATVPMENNASLRTKGFDLSLTWKDVIRINDDNLSYSIRANLSDYTSEITNYYNESNYLGNYYKGMVIGEIWGLNTLGFFKTDEEAKNGAILENSSYKQYYSAGCLKFEDVNGDGKISKGAWTLEDHGDFEVIGNTTPRFQYGITFSTMYKGFDLTAFFTGIGKRDIYPSSESTNFWGPYNRKYQILLKHTVEDRWTPENTDAYFPKPMGYIALSDRELGTPQTRYLQNAAYIRLKNLVVGYTLPKSLTRKIKLDNVRVFCSGQNLFCLTKLTKYLDPEGLTKDPDAYSDNVGMGTSYPIQQVYSFGIEIRY